VSICGEPKISAKFSPNRMGVEVRSYLYFLLCRFVVVMLSLCVISSSPSGNSMVSCHALVYSFFNLGGLSCLCVVMSVFVFGFPLYFVFVFVQQTKLRFRVG
jgi:hypothetical protein